MDIQVRALAYILNTVYASGMIGFSSGKIRNGWVALDANKDVDHVLKADAFSAAMSWVKCENITRQVQTSGDNLCLSAAGYNAMTKRTWAVNEGQINFSKDYAKNEMNFCDFFEAINNGSLKIGDHLLPAILIQITSEARSL
jgi:hypothetical protein